MTSSQREFPIDAPASLPAQPLAVHLNHGMQERRMHPVPGIPGLYYFPDFLDGDVQHQVVGDIDAGQWRNDLERRVQHYGWRYDYRTRTITPDMDLGPLPAWAAGIAERLFAEMKLFDRVPEQVIVNEYKPGQGIALHADRDCFGDTVATVSLGDDWEMKLRPVAGTADEDKRIMLVRGSALIMSGEARSRWMHGIDKRKREKNESGQRERQRRLSLTFRTVLGQSSELHPVKSHAATAV